VNEAVAMGVAVCVDPIAAAAANILALQTGLLHPPNTVVWSSLADASICGFAGFQLTQLTVPE
jgi:hypothetical protein